MSITPRAITLSETLLAKAAIRRNLLVELGLILGFSWITALCAQLAFWIGPVPITGQTFGVLLSGAVLGSRRGALSQIAYLGQGALGLPIFAGGHSGVAYG